MIDNFSNKKKIILTSPGFDFQQLPKSGHWKLFCEGVLNETKERQVLSRKVRAESIFGEFTLLPTC